MSKIYSRLVLAEVRLELLHLAHAFESEGMKELLQQVLKTVTKIDEMDRDLQQCLRPSFGAQE
ncbi:hypothetical protein [Bacillus sp. Marseille-P3800]|uniref:hypothetical protein n=1 Tax=Bacillus sp. Marseille-P3800 TaxID=2014782 RepID=UPI000C0760FE|nr:hypothetical protein [Bacillus sp. Marseille-P3800]